MAIILPVQISCFHEIIYDDTKPYAPLHHTFPLSRRHRPGGMSPCWRDTFLCIEATKYLCDGDRGRHTGKLFSNSNGPAQRHTQPNQHVYSRTYQHTTFNSYVCAADEFASHENPLYSGANQHAGTPCSSRRRSWLARRLL
jgi:hypothetical protein